MIGVFGGTFDPPHLAHRILAMEALEHFSLKKVLWVLTATPPHKPDREGASLADRLDMLHAALKEEDRFEICRADIERPAPHYALGTMQWLRERFPAERFLYLIGGDSLRDLPGWYQAARFVDEVEILAVLSRPGVEIDYDSLEQELPGITAKVRLLETPAMQISASVIRSRIREGRAYRHFLLPEVARLIESRGLYIDQS